MTVTLTYDDTLSRVNIVADALAAADTALIERSTDQVLWTTVRGGDAVPVTSYAQATDDYGRTVAAGSWGTATTGQIWSVMFGGAGQLSVNGSQGIIAIEAVNATRAAMLPYSHVDVDLLVDVLIPVVPATSSIRNLVFLRRTDNSNYYVARIDITTASAVTVNLRKNLAGSENDVSGGATVTVAALTASTTVPLRVRVQMRGAMFRIRVWLSNAVEPTTWHLTASDTAASFSSGTHIGLGGLLVAGNTNTLPVNQAWDNLVVSTQFEAHLSDYEFDPDVVNYYRVRGVEASPITFIGSGATVNDANAAGTSTLAPALAAGLVTGDLMLLSANIRNSGAGAVATPTGWTSLLQAGNCSLFGRLYVTGDAAPTVSFTGGVANATITAKTFAFRSAALSPLTTAAQLNGSTTDIAYPAVTVTQNGCVLVAAGWRQDDCTSVAPIATFTELQDVAVTAGDDVHVTLDYLIETTATNLASGAWVLTGAVAAISRALMAVFEHADYLNSQTASITPTLDSVWIKSIARPFLNQKVTQVYRDDRPVVRPARAGIFDVVGRTLPIAVSTVRASRRWTMFLRTTTAVTAENLDLALASGDVLLIQAPAACDTETGYVSVGDTTVTSHPLRPLKKTFALPMTEVAPPGPDVVGATSTWQSVLNAYATWADVLAANLTWADLLTLIGDPSEVIVS